MNGLKNIILMFLVLSGIIGNLKAQEQTPISLTLEKALEIAMSENPTIKIADREIQKTKYSKKEIEGNLYPNISATAGYDRAIKIGVVNLGGQSFKMGSDNTYNAGLVMGMPLFNMELYKSIQLSEINIGMALESARASKLNLKNEVEKAYYAALFTEDVFSVMQKTMENAQRNYNDAKNRYEQGLAAEYDLITAEVRVSNIKPNLIGAENNIKMAYLQLKMLMGIALEENVEVSGNLMDYETKYENFESLYGYSLTDNSTLKQLEIQSQLLNKQLELQKASYLPTLNLSYNYLYRGMANGAPFSEFNWNPSSTLSFALNIPIFEGFIRKNKVAQIKTNIEELKFQRDYTESGLNVQVKNALINMQKAIEQLESNKSGVRSAEKALTIAQARYKSGLGTVLELNTSEIALTEAKLNYNQSIYSYMVAESDYELLIGKEN